MKKLILIIILFLSISNINAQECVPYVRLTWGLPECFDVDNNRVLVFAKKTVTLQPTYGEWLLQNTNSATSMYGAVGECNNAPNYYANNSFNYLIFNNTDANGVDIGDSLTSLIGKDVKIIEAANPKNYLYIPNVDVDSLDITHYMLLTTEGYASFTLYGPPVGSRIIVKEVIRFSELTPTQDPTLYGTGDTSLAPLDGVLPDSLKFELDPLVQLIYNGVGTSVIATYHDVDTALSFLLYNSAQSVMAPFDFIYSRGVIIEANTDYPADVTNAVAVEGRVQWVPPVYSDAIMVVVNQGDSVDGAPIETMSYYLTGVDNDFSLSTSYYNTVDDTNGKVVYLFDSDRFSLEGLSKTTYHIKLFNHDFNCWSPGYKKYLDNTIKF